MNEMIYLIVYEINEQLHDYSDLKEAIKAYGDYQHPMETLWLIRVNDDISVNDVSENLRKYLHFNNDHIFVMEVPQNIARQGWLPRTFWKWLKQYV